MQTPWFPIDRATTQISASTTSASGAILRQPTGRHQLRIYNRAAATAHYRLVSAAAGVASITEDPGLPAGGIEVITVENAEGALRPYLAVVLEAGAGTVEISTGVGA